MRAAVIAIGIGVAAGACAPSRTGAPPRPAAIARELADAVTPHVARALASAARDPADAARLLDIAAARGSAEAMFLLGNAYRAGAGVPRDPARALALYQRAAERELPAALQTLAMAYQHGELGLEPDDDEARRYAMEAEHALHDSAPAPAR